ncbi:LYR motif-containing protein 4 isoform X1 [Tachysurus fulvidraco]|uniref:LYR motif-containing protein 4 isoform X1 n=1 Tax=Tachysurus fulvidraco TaxID=1234273 RepID=UPI001FF01A84|nr:LYR motif-containing protein 4 isoform X1 [Tachysurus fulvidraco]
MAAPSRTQVLALYRMLLKESNKFPSYNYRTYALRRVRETFRDNRNVEDPKVLEQLLSKAWDNLAIIQRQSSPSPPSKHLLREYLMDVRCSSLLYWSKHLQNRRQP